MKTTLFRHKLMAQRGTMWHILDVKESKSKILAISECGTQLLSRECTYITYENRSEDTYICNYCSRRII